jgi:hypothetical protein
MDLSSSLPEYIFRGSLPSTPASQRSYPLSILGRPYNNPFPSAVHAIGKPDHGHFALGLSNNTLSAPPEVDTIDRRIESGPVSRRVTDTKEIREPSGETAISLRSPGLPGNEI